MKNWKTISEQQKQNLLKNKFFTWWFGTNMLLLFRRIRKRWLNSNSFFVKYEVGGKLAEVHIINVEVKKQKFNK